MIDTLNDAQRQAVEFGDGPVLIMAGPGTGKTKTLVARIEHLIQTGVSPDRILALTFTKKAAQEMHTRLATKLQKPKIPKVYTFHALCNSLLDNAAYNFATDSQMINIIRQIQKPTKYKGVSARELKLLISNAKNSPVMSEHKKLVDTYNQALENLGLCDFDDLLVHTRDLLLQNKSKWQEIQARYTHILVDEFQDTNALQYELLRLMRGNDNLFVIGDPNQSIYGFRGASHAVFDQFKQDFGNCTSIRLTANYRSAKQVVAVSNALLGDGLQAKVASPGRARAVEVLNEYSEANWVLAEIQQAIGGSDFQKAVSNADGTRCLKDFAILYRSRHAARALQKAIEASGLPYQIVGDGSPYDQPEVQAIINQLRAVDTAAPPHARAEQIIAGANMTLTPELRQFVSSLVRFDTTKQALEYIDTLAEQDFYDPRADAITLLTIHAAKGLEFKHVFLIGANEGVLPNTQADIAEEKRLFYVAVTRAKENLDILYSRFRAGTVATMSRFIKDLPVGVLPRVVDSQLAGDQRRAVKRRAKRAQTTLF